jgi:hypothetical protein
MSGDVRNCAMSGDVWDGNNSGARCAIDSRRVRCRQMDTTDLRSTQDSCHTDHEREKESQSDHTQESSIRLEEVEDLHPGEHPSGQDVVINKGVQYARRYS